MSAFDSSGIPGWYPDPSGTIGQERFWNGVAWTEQVRREPIPTGASAHRDRMATLRKRPMDAGQIIDGAVWLLQRQAKLLVGLPMIVAAGVALLAIVVGNAVGAAAFRSLTTGGGGFWTTLVVGYMVLLCAVYIALTTVESVVIGSAEKVVGSGSATWTSAMETLRRWLPHALGVVFVGAVLPLLPLLFVSALILHTRDQGLWILMPLAWCFAVWIVTRYSLALPALIVEETSVSKALSRSAGLVQGSWWRVFGIQLVPMVVMWALFLPLSGVLSGFFALLTWGVSWPFYALVLLLQYYDLQARRTTGATKIQAVPGTPESF